MSRDTKALAALMMAVFSYALMQTVVVPALGLLTRELRTTPAWSTWILSAFLLSSAVLTPLLGRMGDLYGKRRLLLGVLAVYTLGMAGAAMAQDIGQLIAARAVQGSALALVPLSMALLREAMPPARLPFAMGLISGIVGAGAGAGLVVGGLLADYLSWRSLFVLGAVLALVSLLMAVRWIPAGEPAARGRLDLPGAALLGLGLVALLLALTLGPSWGWTSAGVLGLFVLAVVAFAVLVVVERRRDDPLIDVAELTDRPMFMTHAAAFLFGAGSYFFYLAMPLFAQQDPAATGIGFGASVTMAGLLMLPGMLAIIPAGMVVGRMAAAWGPRWPLVAGFALAAAGAVLLAVAHAQMWQHLLFYAVVGAGSGLALGSLPKLIADIVPLSRTGTANGVNNIVRTVGSTVGSQLAAVVIASGVSNGAFTTLFWLAAAACVLGVVIAPLAVAPRAAEVAR